MRAALLAVIVGIPLAWHLALAAIVSVDAPRAGLPRRKWTLVALAVPVFGFFAYLFERSERDYDPEADPYAQGRFNVHPSRRDDERSPERAQGGDARADAPDDDRDRDGHR